MISTIHTVSRACWHGIRSVRHDPPTPHPRAMVGGGVLNRALIPLNVAKHNQGPPRREEKGRGVGIRRHLTAIGTQRTQCKQPVPPPTPLVGLGLWHTSGWLLLWRHVTSPTLGTGGDAAHRTAAPPTYGPPWSARIRRRWCQVLKGRIGQRGGGWGLGRTRALDNS